MPPRPRLTMEDRVRDVVLHEEGYSCNKIAKRMKVARNTIQEIVRKYRETGSGMDRAGRGRKKITTTREDRIIKHFSLRNRRKTSNAMANDLKNEYNIKVSARTVRRRLQTSGLNYCRAKKKSLLTTAARKKRLAWAREYIDFDWSKVLFTDESRFCLVSDRPVSVRRRQGEEYLPESLNTTMKHDGGGIMVWAVLPRMVLVVCTKSLEI